MNSARPIGIKLLVSVLLLLSAFAIPSGIAMLSDPSGKVIGAQTILPYLTKAIPFLHDFSVVGIFLVAVYGVLPIVFAYGVWTRSRLAWILTLLLGITEIVWIAAEIIMFSTFGFFFFYPIIAGMGVVTVGLSLLPSVRKFYLKSRQHAQ